MCDGSLQKDKHTLILHTQSFSFQENIQLQSEINDKFQLHSRVIRHKKHYYVLEIPRQDSHIVAGLIEDHLFPSMRYKLPGTKKSC